MFFIYIIYFIYLINLIISLQQEIKVYYNIIVSVYKEQHTAYRNNRDKSNFRRGPWIMFYNDAILPMNTVSFFDFNNITKG
jgi:hypothetical protein